MSEKKNIDRLFQEKFKDFEVVPNDAVWNRINESLPNKKKKRRVIPLWWQIGGIAAAIAILLTIGVSVFTNYDNKNSIVPFVNSDANNTEKNTVEDEVKRSTTPKQNKLKTGFDDIELVDSNNDQDPTLENQKDDSTNANDEAKGVTTTKGYQENKNTVVKNHKSEEKLELSKKSNLLINKSDTSSNAKVADNTVVNSSATANENTNQLDTDSQLKSAIKDSKAKVAELSSAITLNSESSATETTKPEKTTTEPLIAENQNKQSIEDAIAEHKDTDLIIEEEEDKQNRWSIAPNVAPVYYSSLGEGSSLNSQFNENSKGGDINMSYGITGSYAISKKLKVRAGINRVDLNQTTSDVFAFTGAEIAARGTEAAFGNISFKNGTQHVSLMSSNMMNRSSVPESFNTKIAGDIDQQFGFIEVPLELEYRVLDTKFGVNIIGGFSTFFLNQNEIYADINGVSTFIGEANNINDTSFSANFGLGMDYSLSKQWNINLEPTFKYQINTFNNTSGDFRPFFVGVYTGLSFKF
jgi:hypothetical protein